MRRKFTFAIVFFAYLFSSNSHAATLEEIKQQLQSTPYMLEVPADNTAIFSTYCTGDSISAQIPQPNYANPLVLAAAKKLTEAKTLANTRLTDKSKAKFIKNLESTKQEVAQLVQNAKNPQIKGLLEILLKDLNQPNISNLSESGVNAYTELKQVLLANLKSNVTALAPLLQKELKSISVNDFTVLINKLVPKLKKEIPPVDFKKLSTLTDSINSVFKKMDVPFDNLILKKTTEQILSLKDQKKNEELASLQEDAQGLLTALDNPPKKQPEFLSNYVETIYDELTYQNDNIANNPILVQARGVFEKEYIKAYVKKVITQSQQLKEMFAKKSLESKEIKYQAQTLYYTLQNSDLIDKIKLSAQKKQLLNDYFDIYKSFNGDTIFTTVQQIQADLATTDEQQQQGSFQSAQYLIQLLDDFKLSKETLEVISSLNTLLALKNSSTIIQVTQEAANYLKTINELTNENFVNISDLSYYLTDKLSVSSETQKVLLETIHVYAVTETLLQLSDSLTPAQSETEHFYFYGGIRRLYELSKKLPEPAIKAGANADAHWFLTQLCGEFRDRASMIEAKVKWINNMNILANQDVTVVDPQTLAAAKNVWMRINAAAYYPFLNVSAALWNARKDAQSPLIAVGSTANVDNPVAGLTVCETKYLFAKYVSQKQDFDDLNAFNNGYEQFKKDCPANDLSDYYDFRGDSNFKHYSPESNAMIWQATSLASGCTSATKARNNSKYTDEDCENYFKRPFFYRYNAARAGLATWLFRDDKYAQKFSTQGEMVAIYPHQEPFNAPFAFGFDQTTTAGALLDFHPEWLSVPGAWNSPDIGFNAFAGLGTNTVNYDRAYTLIRDAVDRHTDWYSSGYNDGNGTSKDQAYSPFVASSYVMQSSDGFTSCGTTVQCPPDGLKRWMFVFRIKAKNWYTPQRIANNEPVDFDKMWFDETSFGVSNLADSEHAWDRLGTAMEEELDSILYLINVDSNGFEGEGD